MKAQEFVKAVGVATLDFQGEVIASPTISESLCTYLRTEAFPLSAPSSLRSASDYGGVKLFSYQRQSLCIAQFYDAGKKDRFQRAVASASIVVFPYDLLRSGFRNLRALREFLADMAANAVDDTSLIVLHSLFEEGVLFSNEQELVSVVKQRAVDYDLLAASIGLMAAYHKLNICSSDRGAGMEFCELLFALAPIEFFDSIAWCTYSGSSTGSLNTSRDANGLHGSNGSNALHEEVLVHNCSLEQPREEKSWLGGVKSRLFREEAVIVPAVDLQTRALSVPDRKDHRYRLAQRVIYEIRDNRLRLALAFEQRVALLIEIIGNITRHTNSELTLKALLPDGSPHGESIDPVILSNLKDFLKEELSRKVL